MTNLPISSEDLRILLGQLIFTVEQSPADGGAIWLPLTEYQAFIIKLLLEDALYDPCACKGGCGKHVNFFDNSLYCEDCDPDDKVTA